MPAAEIVAPAKITGSRINQAANASRALIFEQTDRIRDIFAGLFFLILLIVVFLPCNSPGSSPGRLNRSSMPPQRWVRATSSTG